VAYPSLEQYNEAFQHPETALTDKELKRGNIKKNGWGLPLALCGGFALTYNISASNKKYAVRCFHKESAHIEKRYKAVSDRIKTLNSQYFLPFDFQKEGIRVGGSLYPIVKMQWAAGETLGEYVETNRDKKGELQALIASLKQLSAFLETNKIAHGDIQPGNIMVSSSGRSVQLIDYDGMFVEAIKGMGSSELGHRNFQHPKRDKNCWDCSLDRFSFISVIFSLQILLEYPQIWRETQSDADAFLFRANDFNDPSQSKIFQKLCTLPKFSNYAERFAAICGNSFAYIPSLDDFISGKAAFQTPTAIKTSTVQRARKAYISAYPVLDASNYELCFNHVGDMVELVGKVFKVKNGIDKNGNPYIFINFGDWRKETVKINIWSEMLAKITQKPDNSWTGRWIYVSGLMDAPHHSQEYGYTHLSVTISQDNQLHFLSEDEAKYRLGATSEEKESNNQRLLSKIKGEQETLTDIIFQDDLLLSEGNQRLLSKIKGEPEILTESPQQNTVSKNMEVLDKIKSRRVQTGAVSPAANPIVSKPPAANPPASQPNAPQEKSLLDHLITWAIIIIVIVIFAILSQN
jgi:serine/threonine protein kinase